MSWVKTSLLFFKLKHLIYLLKLITRLGDPWLVSKLADDFTQGWGAWVCYHGLWSTGNYAPYLKIEIIKLVNLKKSFKPKTKKVFRMRLKLSEPRLNIKSRVDILKIAGILPSLDKVGGLLVNSSSDFNKEMICSTPSIARTVSL